MSEMVGVDGSYRLEPSGSFDSVDSLTSSLNRASISSSSSSSFTIDSIRCEVFNFLPPNEVAVIASDICLDVALANISTAFSSATSAVLVVPTNLLHLEGTKTVSKSEVIESITGHCYHLIKDRAISAVVETLQFYASSESAYLLLCKIFAKLTGTRARSQSHTTHDYYKKSLTEADAIGYKAAGLVLYRRKPDSGEYEFLLGETKQQLTTLGGKIDHKSDSCVYDTAVREFNEETSLLLEPAFIVVIRKYLKEKGEGSRIMWYSGGKFALCFLLVDALPGLYEATDCLPQRMKELQGDSERLKQLPSACREMEGLRWISTSDFKALGNNQLSKFLSRMKTSIGFEAWLGSLKGSTEYPTFAERFRANTV